MSYDPRNEGAQCDKCPLGPRGCLRQGKGAEPWEPVRSERHATDGYPTAPVVAVIESPGEDGVRHGYPFAGREGGEWVRGLAAAGLHRSDVDLVSVISCKPPGAPGGAWKRLKHQLDRHRKRRVDELKATGTSKARAVAQAAQEIPHPATCCRPRLLSEVANYLYALTLGSTATKAITGTRSSIFEMAGDMVEMPAAELFAGMYSVPLDWVVKVMPTFAPGFVLRSPSYRPPWDASIRKAFRWFNGALHWEEPEAQTQPGADELEAWLSVDAPYWTYDYETDGIDQLTLRVRCLAIATPDLNEAGEPAQPGEPVSQLCRAVGINILSADGMTRFYSRSEEDRIKDVLRRFFTDPTKLKVGHNAGSFDRMVSEGWLGVTPLPLLDTLFLARFTHPDLPKGLKPTGRRLTDVHRWETNSKGEKCSSGDVADDERLAYCIMDVAVNSRIVPPLLHTARLNGCRNALPEWSMPDSFPQDARWDLETVDHRRQDMCVDMHRNGVYVDQAARLKLQRMFEEVAYKLRGDLVVLAQGEGLNMKDEVADDGLPDFAPGSYDQLRDLLYEKWRLGPPPLMKATEFWTETGLPGTGDAVIRAHLARPELTDRQRRFLITMRQYRRVRNKILGSQLIPMQLKTAHEKGKVDPDGRVRSNWNSHTTSVGRLSSSGPNLQNQSSRKDIGGVRRIYCAAPGHVLIGCDLDQAHLRITANYWRITRLLECFEEQLDPHCWLADDLFGKAFREAPGWGEKGFSLRQDRKPNKKKKAGQMREMAKTYRYASIYAASPETKLSVITATEITQLDEVSRELSTAMPYLRFALSQVRMFDQIWHEQEPDWKRAWKEMTDLYGMNGCAMTEPLFHRRSGGLSDGKLQEVVNFPVLACESSVMSICEERVRDVFPHQKWGPGTGMVAQVHDSIIVEIPEHLADWGKAALEECMTVEIPGWEVPFTCEADAGMTWMEV